MKNLINISQVAEHISAFCHPCSDRTAWSIVNRNPKLIPRVRRGKKFVFFSVASVERLAAAINSGGAK
jgi:hypothetical protein